MSAVALILAGCLLAARRHGWYLAAFPIAYLLPALAINLPAIGRMTCVLFPGFLGLASVLSRTRVLALGALGAVLQIWLAMRFFTWQTPY